MEKENPGGSMTRGKWKTKIKKACKDAGTYREFFDQIIETLSSILEMRDNALEKFDASGGNTIVKHTNKGGATNIVKNPALQVVLECNAQALTYWRELGLTPAGLKKINEEGLKPKPGSEGEATLTALQIIRNKKKITTEEKPS